MVEREVPEVVVCRLRLRDLIVRLWLTSVDEVREFHSILNEEHGNVVTHYVPVALLSVKLDSEPSNISHGISTATAAEDSRETDKDGRFAGGIGQDGCKTDVLSTLEKLEAAEGTSTSGMYDTLGNALMIESVDLESIALAS